MWVHWNAKMNAFQEYFDMLIVQMKILDGWELYHFNIRGPLIVGAALSEITSLVHIFLKVAWRQV